MQPALGASNETTQPDSPSDWTIADGTAVGRFVVLATIGRGATGVVVAAFDRELGRKVAIKFLSQAVTRQQARLRSEAQALARLSHPHVVRIHDVGEHDGRVSMVMEYVEGDTLAGVRISGTRGLDVWIAAGRGLAAAHRAGLVHGDFKPANVLLGRDGRARVGDFGHAALEAGPDTDPQPAVPRDDGRTAEMSTTTSGMLFGTPAYMAPEVFAGAPATARSDQFSFCVALYEALWSTRPFAGADVASLAAAVTSGALRSPPTFPVVPLRVRRAVLRGLATDPESRFPNMDALLAELQRDPWKWPRRIAPMLAAAALPWGFSALGTEPAVGDRDYCSEVELRADALWSRERAGAIEGAFLATAAPFAADEYARASALVATAADSLRTAERDACEAARDGSASGEEIATRQLCLHLQHQQLAALLDVFERADATLVEHAGDAARGLPTPDACAGGKGAPRVGDGQRDEMLALGTDVARARVAVDAWRDAAALEATDAAVARAAELDAPWFAAQAHLIAGRVLERSGDATAAMPRFDAAFAAALASDQPAVAVSAAIGLAGALAERGNHDEAVLWLGHAEAAIGRTGDRREALRRSLLHARGEVAYHHGEFVAAKAAFSELLATESDEADGGSMGRGATLLNIGLCDANLGDNDAGIIHLRAALDAEIERHGDAHPALIRPLNAICHVEIDRGDTAAAVEACRRAIDVSRASSPGPNPRLSHLLTNLGSAHFHGGDPAQAEAAHLASLDNAMRTQPDDDLLIASIANNLGVLYDHLERVDAAAEHYEHALARVTQAFGAAHPSTAMVGTNLAMVRVKQGDFDGAERLIRDGLTHMAARFGTEHPDLALGHAELGRLEAKRGEHAAAIGHFQRAHALRSAKGGDDIELADTSWGLASSLAEMHGRTPAVERYAAQARALYVGAGGDWATRASELDAWLAGLR